MHPFAHVSPIVTSVLGFIGAGAFQRKSPTWSDAQGMPVKIVIPLSVVPLTAPPVTLASVMSANAASMGNRASRMSAMLRMCVPAWILRPHVLRRRVYNRSLASPVRTLLHYQHTDVVGKEMVP